MNIVCDQDIRFAIYGRRSVFLSFAGSFVLLCFVADPENRGHVQQSRLSVDVRHAVGTLFPLMEEDIEGRKPYTIDFMAD